MTELEARLKRLQDIRDEHYPLMVDTLMEYIRMHGDPGHRRSGAP